MIVHARVLSLGLINFEDENFEDFADTYIS